MLQLLGELLLDRANVKVMMRYVSDAYNLRQMMLLLKDSSRSIQFEAFHVFKVILAVDWGDTCWSHSQHVWTVDPWKLQRSHRNCNGTWPVHCCRARLVPVESADDPFGRCLVPSPFGSGLDVKACTRASMLKMQACL